jgi:CO/xanthine dehydrogenase FAD-binding subunit
MKNPSVSETESTSMIEQYSAPTSIEEATRLMHDGKATILAGGTDLMPQTESGKRQFENTLLNIRRIDGLSDISVQGGQVRIGTLATITQILESKDLATVAPVLVEAADHFASSQLRNAATIGGNVCNASPAGDMIIPLLLLDAQAVLASWSDGCVVSRHMPISEFFAGPGTTCKRAEELLTAIEFAVPADGFVGRFLKSGPRPALEISTISLGIAGVLRDSALHHPRVAIGAAAPTPIRATRVEAALDGKRLDDSLIARASEQAAEEAVPIDDVRASAWYRTHLIRVFARRLLQDVAGQD